MWREITEADVLGVLNAAEKRAFTTLVKGEGQDVFADISVTVVQQCRGYIADHPQNSLADGNTLPDRAILPALHMIRVEMLTRLDQEVSDARAKAAANALRFFEQVARGEVSLEQPTGATEEAGGGSKTETLSSRARQATRQKLSGL